MHQSTGNDGALKPQRSPSTLSFIGATVLPRDLLLASVFDNWVHRVFHRYSLETKLEHGNSLKFQILVCLTLVDLCIPLLALPGIAAVYVFVLAPVDFHNTQYCLFAAWG